MAASRPAVSLQENLSARKLAGLYGGLYRDSRQNVSPGILHISESTAAEPLFEIPLQRTRAVEFNVTLGQGDSCMSDRPTIFGSTFGGGS